MRAIRNLGHAYAHARLGSIAAFAVALLGQLYAPSAAKAEDFTIGVINAMTGIGADLGIASQQAIEPFVEEFNRSAGTGTRLNIIFRDDESNPQKGVAAAHELLQRYRVNMIMGTNLTNVAFAVAPIVNQAKIPFITMATGSALIDPQKFPYSFRTNIPTDLEARTLVDHVVRQSPGKKYGLMVDTTALGQAGAQAVRNALKAHNLEPIAYEAFNPADTDLTAQGFRLQKAGVETLFVWSNGLQLAHAARSFERIGFAPQVFGGFGTHQEAFIRLAGPAGSKWAATIYRGTTRSENEPPPANIVAYYAKLKSRWGDKLTTTVMLAAMWNDMLNLVVDVVKRSKGRDGDSIKAALEDTKNFKGMMSSYSFSPARHDGLEPSAVTIAYVLGVQDNIRTRVPGMP
ncbi:MAG TPA: ABC transporter substrate-binding protein [Xanthobacteraceae bacterium]